MYTMMSDVDRKIDMVSEADMLAVHSLVLKN